MAKRRNPARSVRIEVGPQEVHTVIPSQVVLPADVPEILIDGLSGVQVVNGIVRFNCFAVRQQSAEGGNVPTIVLRLAMAVPTLIGIHQAVSQLVEKLQPNGNPKAQSNP